ncbi:uncharacterized protein LOC129775097 [Toxorhynchites rutilus septentrionalis]|uniref:uncharacterized protein LOC129775097 n=1 Tax=Toxorhynchites rutilus septentrionalis TaxID=329112 RepID=UPI0024784703|nr:uncharacterized protein LOC129775097 [Toxorhynchites rutilus septentrionalis]
MQVAVQDQAGRERKRGTAQGENRSGAMFAEIRKRKTDPDVVPIPSKQFLSEEVMASHLNSLHLSSEYTSHNIETESGEDLPSASDGFSPSSSLDDEMSLGEAPGSPLPGSHHVYMSPQELEDRLKKAQRISLCEEVRKLDSRTEILPKVLLERIEKPCTALVIWQPPQPLEKLISKSCSTLKEKEQHEDEQRSIEEAMGEDEPLPDLPDYDDDLDFEENNNNVATLGDLNRMDVEM